MLLRQILNKDLAWPVGIIIFMAVFMTCMIGTLVFSRTVPVNLVSEQYYQESINFQKQLESDVHARQAGQLLNFQYDPKTQQIEFKFSTEVENPGALQVHFFRPSDAMADIEFRLPWDKGGYDPVRVAEMQKGFWRVRTQYLLGEDLCYQEFQFMKVVE